MNARKRKADDDLDHLRDAPSYDDMSVSPLSSPAIPNRPLARPTKKVRSNEVVGRPLALPRLLETLDADSLRSVLQKICERHQEIGNEVVHSAPRPSVASALAVLENYNEKLRAAFPFGDNNGSDYAYNRVKVQLAALIDAITDFVPHYLPPNETQTTTSLTFLDGATNFIHQLPDWDSTSYRYHKDNAYDEISKAWALVISEASKRGGGFQIHNGEWDQKLQKHNQQSGGKMQSAVSALGNNLGWIGAGQSQSSAANDPNSIRNQLFNGTYGSNLPVKVGPW
jgi:protein Cut8